MADQERIRFTFVSQGLSEDTFQVVRFHGNEGISKLYEFTIELFSEDPEIDLGAVLRNPATLTIYRDDGEERRIHGIPSQFEQLHEDGERIFYRAVLVPRLWQADLYHENQLFLDKTVPDIIEEILRQTGLTTDDYELRLTRSYPEWEYICQYKETDFDFISRWMEREGIYYYFQQTQEMEKLIITDNSASHENIPDTSTIEYHPPSSIRAREEEIVRELVCRQKMLPRRVILRDYNYRRPDLDLRAEADVDPQGRGDVYSYGEHFKTPEEGNALAAIRAEEILCGEVMFYGEGTVAGFCPGFLFDLSGHYRDSYNRSLLITELEHQGDQARALLGTDERSTDGDSQLLYSNRSTCIPADVQYRPARSTPKPRFFGTMNARVDAAGDGQYAELDDDGRYRIRLPFDQSDRQDGRASRYVRMAQPYAGADYGMHFPLHRGTEVLLTFIDGDPDRPIISAAVPNPETRAPVTSENQTQCFIMTGGGNHIYTEDRDGNQLVEIRSPTANSLVRVGAPNPDGPTGIRERTDQNKSTTVGGWETRIVGSQMSMLPHGAQAIRIVGDRNLAVTGAETITIDGGQTQTIGEMQDITVRGPQTVHVTGTQTITAENKRTVNAPEEEKNIASARTLNVTGTDTTEVRGTRTVTVHGSETRQIDSENGMNFVSDNKMHGGFKNELFLGQKGDYNLALALEVFAGVKLALGASINASLHPGLKFGREPTDIKDRVMEFMNSKIGISKSTLKLFLG